LRDQVWDLATFLSINKSFTTHTRGGNFTHLEKKYKKKPNPKPICFKASSRPSWRFFLLPQPKHNRPPLTRTLLSQPPPTENPTLPPKPASISLLHRPSSLSFPSTLPPPVTEKQHQNHRPAFPDDIFASAPPPATTLHHNLQIAARHSGAHRSQIGPPSSPSSSPSTAVPTTPDLSAAHPSTPSSTSLPDRAGPSSSSDTPPRPNTTASPHSVSAIWRRRREKQIQKRKEHI